MAMREDCFKKAQGEFDVDLEKFTDDGDEAIGMLEDVSADRGGMEVFEP